MFKTRMGDRKIYRHTLKQEQAITTFNPSRQAAPETRRSGSKSSG
jgi:hypothetical protein